MTLEELFRKYLDDRMTPEELALFREMATREENRAEMNRLFAAWIDREFPHQQQEEVDIDALYLELIQKKNIPMGEAGMGRTEEAMRGRGRDGGRMIRLASSLAAAACVLVAVGFFLLRRPAVPAPQKAPGIVVASVITPASDKAVLTLADGRRIVLDSAANGMLASQGGMQIVKAGGVVAYRGEGGADGMGEGGGDGTGGGGKAGDVGMNQIATPRGGFYEMVLPDGSKVWLDAASSLRYPTVFAGGERRVQLTGEAYFEVAPRAGQPFYIDANNVTVQVLGTELNLMAYSDEDAIRATLINGALRVVRGDDQRQIQPGQQASWSHGSSGWQVSHPDMREVLAWKQGEFRFEGQAMAAIMRQIARWYDVDVVLKGSLPEVEFNGVISRKKSVTELLTVVEQTDEVHFTLVGRKVIVEAGKRPDGN
jgi:transmembrane sensor